MIRACFVTATGTEIGKTLVTAALAWQLRERGVDVEVWKPLLSGMDEVSLTDSDAGVLLRASGRASGPTPNEAEIARITPWRFGAALSPDVAAAREERTIDFDELCDFGRKAAGQGDVSLIEGVGGVMAPVDDSHTVLDWIDALRVPTLLVAGTYLGTISHTLSALEALRARQIAPHALVLSESAQNPMPVEETARAIARRWPALPIAHVPRLDGREPWQTAPALLHLLEK